MLPYSFPCFRYDFSFKQQTISSDDFKCSMKSTCNYSMITVIIFVINLRGAQTIAKSPPILHIAVDCYAVMLCMCTIVNISVFRPNLNFLLVISILRYIKILLNISLMHECHCTHNRKISFHLAMETAVNNHNNNENISKSLKLCTWSVSVSHGSIARYVLWFSWKVKTSQYIPIFLTN